MTNTFVAVARLIHYVARSLVKVVVEDQLIIFFGLFEQVTFERNIRILFDSCRGEYLLPDAEFVDLTAHIGRFITQSKTSKIRHLAARDMTSSSDLFTIAIHFDVASIVYRNCIVVPFASLDSSLVGGNRKTSLADQQATTIVSLDLEGAVDVTNTAAEVGELRRIHPPVDGEVLGFFGDGLLAQFHASAEVVERKTILRVSIDNGQTA